MKNTQNEKISQIKISTLVVGIDVGKETHYARAFVSVKYPTPTHQEPLEVSSSL